MRENEMNDSRPELMVKTSPSLFELFQCAFRLLIPAAEF